MHGARPREGSCVVGWQWQAPISEVTLRGSVSLAISKVAEG